MKKVLLTALLFILSAPALHAQLSPGEFLGFQVGADRKLADWQDILDYFDHLDRASDRVRLENLGQTTLGNPFVFILISKPSVLKDLKSYRETQQLLASAGQVDEPVDALIEKGKTVVLITCAIHSTEVASAQTSMEFAYELATGRDDETEEILRNTIVLLVPALNPDGVNIVNHWYQRTLGTAAEGTHPPVLYHPYAGHDNNRDWYMFTQKETRLTVEKIHNVWHPQIVIDLHEMGRYGARMFVPPYVDPIDPNVDPLLQAGIVRLGATLFAALIERGKRGIVTNALYDAYTPARAYQHYHGGVRILLETASARLATPIHIQEDELASGRHYSVKDPSWNFPVPWQGGDWRLRDIVDYQKIALRAALLNAARYRSSWLQNFYQVGLKALRRKEPYAFVIPHEQNDPQSLYDLLEVLRLGMVEVHQARKPFEVTSSTLVSPPFGEEGKREFSRGSWVVLMQQPYGAFAKTLLEIQHYPRPHSLPGQSLHRPYDVTAHTLGIQLGVEVYQVNAAFDASLRKVSEISVPDGRLNGQGDSWLFLHENNAFALLLNRLLKKGYPAYWAPNGFSVFEQGFPVGTLMVHVNGENERGNRNALDELPVTVHRVERRPTLAWQRIRLPRIGLYKSYDPSMDEGWTRWILEQYEFLYETLHDRDIRQRDLTRFDALIVASQEADSLEHGLGVPYPEAYRGGLGQEGIKRLEEFVRTGGTLIFLGDSADLPLEAWEIGVENAGKRLSPAEFSAPGSLLKVRINNRHPIGYGMPETAAVMFKDSPFFVLSRGLSVVDYDPEGLLSGWMRGEGYLFGKSALVEARIGEGKLILIGFRTQFRAQTRSTYKFLFNSLYYSTTSR